MVIPVAFWPKGIASISSVPIVSRNGSAELLAVHRTHYVLCEKVCAPISYRALFYYFYISLSSHILSQNIAHFSMSFPVAFIPTDASGLPSFIYLFIYFHLLFIFLLSSRPHYSSSNFSRSTFVSATFFLRNKMNHKCTYGQFSMCEGSTCWK